MALPLPTQPRMRLAVAVVALAAAASLAAAEPASPAATPAPAQDPVAMQPLSLQAAWRLAEQQDAGWLAAQAAGRAGEAGVAVARADLLPSVSASYSRGRNALDNDSPAGPADFYDSGSQSLSLRQPLYRPASVARLDKARVDARDAAARTDVERQAAIGRVAEAYFNVLLANSQLGSLQTQQAHAETQIEAARKSRQAGSGTRTDEDEALARRDLLVAQVLEARQARDAAQQTLQRLVQRPVSALMDLGADAPEPGAASVDETLAHWQSLVLAHSPELQSLQARAQSAEIEVRRIRAAHRPTLDAVAQWQRVDRDSVTSNSSRYQHAQVGVQLTVPLYAGGGIEAGARQAEAEAERSAHALEAARRELEAKALTEWRNVAEGRARVLAFEQAMRSATRLVEASEQSLRAGVRTTLDVLAAQERLATARADLARARYLVLLSRLRLALLAGTADDALLQQLGRPMTVPLALPGAAQAMQSRAASSTPAAGPS